MASLRRIVTLSTLIPLTGGTVAALLACAPPPAATHHPAPAQADIATSGHNSAPASVTQASTKDTKDTKDTRRTLEHLVRLTAVKTALTDACHKGSTPAELRSHFLDAFPGKVKRPAEDANRTNRATASDFAGGAEKTAQGHDRIAQHVDHKAYKHMRFSCVSSEVQLNRIDAHLAKVVKQARPIIGTARGTAELKRIETRTAKAFHFDADQTAALHQAVAREIGGVVSSGPATPHTNVTRHTAPEGASARTPVTRQR
ncbi:hypothetical protein ACFCXT_10690 [Streptomyces vinaceus]|uniref:hypothetical protein n=1 Tax=Streptomyces vinaceus TaxID=1960 RepID=UPI0035D7C8D1